MNVPAERRGLLYVVPVFLGRSAAVEAGWIGTANLASALGARLGGVDVLSPTGLMEPKAMEAMSVRATSGPSVGRTIVRHVPGPFRTLLAEARAWNRARLMRGLAARTVNGSYRLVVQRHNRYQDCGLITARRIGAPFVLRIDSLKVREEASWGIRRPLWGSVVERVGELRIIRQADLVASVSDILDAQLAQAGIADDRRVVIPNGVDTALFSPGDPDPHLLRTHGLEGRFVVGWVGGFRPFHGLELVPAIAQALRARLPNALICLVGTGPTRDEIEKRCRGFEDTVRFVGPVMHADVPRWIRSFDVSLLLAGAEGDFHYSPLKLYEYLACGRPIVAPRVGDIGEVLSDGEDGLLVPAGDPKAVVIAIVRLAEDRQLRERLCRQAREKAEKQGSWDARAGALLARLEERRLLSLPQRLAV